VNQEAVGSFDGIRLQPLEYQTDEDKLNVIVRGADKVSLKGYVLVVRWNKYSDVVGIVVSSIRLA
jgi:hypothetical protein